VDGGHKAVDDKGGEKDQPWNEILILIECVSEDQSTENEPEDCQHVEVLKSRVTPKGIIYS